MSTTRMHYPQDLEKRSNFEDSTAWHAFGGATMISLLSSAIVIPVAGFLSLWFLLVYLVPYIIALCGITFYHNSFKTNDKYDYRTAVYKYKRIKDPVARDKARVLMQAIFTHEKSANQMDKRHDNCVDCSPRLRLLDDLREYDRLVELDNSDLEEVRSFLQAKKTVKELM